MGVVDKGKCIHCNAPITGELPCYCYNCDKYLEKGDVI